MARTGVREVRESVESAMLYRQDYPPMSGSRTLSEFEQLVADEAQVRAMREAFEV